ncbi:helix-turn-helix transcriptional regulator [Gordonia shandongensis]|uniref:helix-turn-helix transcriptional regulator n=1 Tax=Gordonia shandongensis TaxID=376351 RepID=UPI00047EDB8B|nr:helix-turn-helix domain-containing protein [Gordonia shandongensis]
MSNRWGPEPVAPPQTAISARQAAVLDALRAAEGGLRVAEVAERRGLHTNTAREHLDALVDAGLAESTTDRPAGRGRPARRYRAVSDAVDPRVEAYRGLAVALAGHLQRTSADPPADALELGRAWGREIAESHCCGGQGPGVLQELEAFGFAPVENADRSIALRRCPLLDAARRYPEVTCQIHLGLIRGTLDAAGDTVTSPALEPFARRGSCTLRLERP